jgi:tetratricopeptide (TPR) repeat protein
VLLEVLHFAGSAFVDFAPLHERIAIDERLVDVASSEGDPSRVLTGHARLLLDLAELGDIARFEETLARMREAALVVGHPRLTWRTSLLGSMSALARGDFAASERLVVEVEQLAPLADDHALSMSLAAHVQHRGRMTYREDLAADALRRVREQMRGVVFGPVLEALIEASTAAWFGDADAARRALSRVKLDVAAKREGILHRMAAEAVALVGTPEEAELLLGVAEPADGLMHVGGHVPMSVDGPVLRTRGLLHAARGDLGRAEEALSAALEISRARGLEPWVARIAFELARVHAAAGRAAEAESLFSDALLRARSLELPGLVALVERERLVGPGARSAVAPTKASAPPPVPAVRDFAMRREGDVWILSFEGRTPRVRDSRGLELLAELVARPQEELHVLALASDRGAPVGDSDAGPQLDQRAAVAYRARLQEIAGVLEQRSDEALVRERDFLEAELARAFGLRGERRAGSTSERARVNVQRRLKDAIRRIGEVDAGLGAYLERAVRTGTFCSFRP